MRKILLIAALFALAVCLTAPFLFFAGRIDAGTYRNALAAASAAWFVLATAHATRRSE